MELSNTNLSTRAHDDYSLVKAAIAGDQRAYSTLMNRYYHSIFNMMHKMVNHRIDAEDLTQEAFSKAFRRLDGYEPRYAFSTWLFKIAINNCIDHIRKKRLQTMSIDEPIEHSSQQRFSDNLKGMGLNPEEGAMRDQTVKLVRQLINRLSHRYRLMIELRFFEELSYDEIAKELGIPLGTVKAQLFRAKELLFEMLQHPSAQSYIDVPSRVARTGSRG